MIDRPDLLIGLDDTDVADSPGTGRLARLLAERLQREGKRRGVGVSRHQHLVDPRIHYTSRNSSACIGLAGDLPEPSELIDRCAAFLQEHSHPASAPGLCVVRPRELDDAVLGFARRTTREVVGIDEALVLARERGLALTAQGGDGSGVIGALAATALRADGNDGRFVDLPGIRDLVGRCTVSRILEHTPVVRVESTEGEPLAPGTWVQTQDWVRPDLVDHQPVVRVRRDTEGQWTTLKHAPDKNR